MTALLKKQMAQLRELSEKREQLAMIMEWRESLKSIKSDMAIEIADYIQDDWEISITESGMDYIQKLVDEFELLEILEAIDISKRQYMRIKGSGQINKAFNSIGGICYNRRRAK